MSFIDSMIDSRFVLSLTGGATSITMIAVLTVSETVLAFEGRTTLTIYAMITYVQSFVASAVLVPIEVSVFLTTGLMIPYTVIKAEGGVPSSVNNATVIGVSAGAGAIAAIIVGVVVFLVRKNRQHEMSIDSAVDEDDIDVFTLRARTKSRTHTTVSFTIGRDSEEESSDNSVTDSVELDEEELLPLDVLRSIEFILPDISSGDDFPMVDVG
jgi:hypothetical protein